MPSNLEFLEPNSKLRKQLFAAYRMNETECVHALLKHYSLTAAQQQKIRSIAEVLIEEVREHDTHNPSFRELLSEYDLSTSEGVALMCLAEAILRIPDKDTIEKLISDKLSHADWSLHLGRSKSKFVNSTTWSLFLTGKLLNLSGVIPNLIKRCGEPIVRQAVTSAVKMLCTQFVLGQTIEEGIQNAKAWEDKGYLFSYDMLGEEARTESDAKDYYDRYMQAIKALGVNNNTNDAHKNSGISIKLSALYPRFEWRKRSNVLLELVPKVIDLSIAAKECDIALTIDAEEAERLDLTLDVLTAVFNDKRLDGWNGLGIAVQAYQRRAVMVIQYLRELAVSRKQRLNVRLVKGAYWDSEIKIAQEKGLIDYPVFTRKAATDLSYIACAKELFAAKDILYPQFATHNAYTAAAILDLAGASNDFEFQALFGMGQELYDLMRERYAVNCRIYAPIGHYNYLFGYLVRRLLENGANNSFVNKIMDDNIAIADLVESPQEFLRHLENIPNPAIPNPANIYGDRPNSRGIDYTNPLEYNSVLDTVRKMSKSYGNKQLTSMNDAQLEQILTTAKRSANVWNKTSVIERINYTQKLAEILDAQKAELIALLVLEGHKTLLDATSEVREAIDYCWYYSKCANDDLQMQTLIGPTGENNQYYLHARGVIVCISPWNFPLAIFMGQILAALLAGNVVIAKPAKQTPQIAQRAIELLYKAGVPKEVVQLAIGSGEKIGEKLVQDSRVNGVMVTGSTDTAWHINRNLAARSGPITPLIAETGGQNVMLVDSSALPEQVVMDVISSAFGNAGQRCSCLRVLYLQEEVADRIITMLSGAMAQLHIGDPQLLVTDIGPVIDRDAFAKLQAHKQELDKNSTLIFEVPVTSELQALNYFPPCAYEIQSIKELQAEVFGPILHVIRYSSEKLSHILQEINATGYGLTLGIHSRIDDTIDFIIQNVNVGNVYVNRNMIGAVVGVQPFGGEGLSGTGPKAGGPYYLPRLTLERSVSINTAAIGGNTGLLSLNDD